MRLISHRGLRFIGVPLVAIGAAAFLLLHSSPGVPRTAGPLNHQVYVWQRSYTPEVTDAIHACDQTFSAVVALAAEVSFQKGQPRIVRITLDHAALKSSAKPVGLAIRIGRYAGPFTADAPATIALCSLARSVLDEADRGGLQVSELQLDFDCAESKLAGYQKWIRALRPTCTTEHRRLTITALPAWLDRSAFASLAADVDDFVLQVHSFRPPTASDEFATLCEPAAARDAIERAARLGRPFRVALPTYSYIVGFDAGGKVLGISAEGPLPQWPAGSRLQLVRSDESQIASLIRTWTADRPRNMEGIIWYRLPVAGDTLNWRPQTLAAAMAGQSPAPKLAVRQNRSDDGAIQLSLANEGNADASVASTTVVADAGEVDAIIASDALGAFDRSTIDVSHGACFEASKALALRAIAPGDSIVVGWVRTREGKEVHCDVETKSSAR